MSTDLKKKEIAPDQKSSLAPLAVGQFFGLGLHVSFGAVLAGQPELESDRF